MNNKYLLQKCNLLFLLGSFHFLSVYLQTLEWNSSNWPLFLCIVPISYREKLRNKERMGVSLLKATQKYKPKEREVLQSFSNSRVKSFFLIKTLCWSVHTSIIYIYGQVWLSMSGAVFLLKSANSLCIKFIMRLKSTVLRKRRVENVLQKPFCLIILMSMPSYPRTWLKLEPKSILV